MIGALTNHLWQSTLFVVAAGLVAAALRKNGAHVRHRIWLIASLKFLVPFSLLMSLGSALPVFRSTASTVPSPSARDLSVVVNQIAQPFADDGSFSSPALATAQAPTNWTAILIGATWACGLLTVGLMRVRGWRRIRAAVRASAPVELSTAVPVRSSPGLLEPGVVGLFRPVLLVPAGIEHTLTSKQLAAVLAHELCHVRRRDNLTSAIHMVVEGLFWFHPLVWFVGARLVDERERACDEHVLRVCGEPRIYAESILNVCKLYVESPIACVSGVSGADLKKRVAAIMGNRIGLQLSLARKLALTTAAVLAIVLPLATGMIVAPLRVLAEAQSSKADRTFDVASVKPCETKAAGPSRSGGAGNQASPSYLYLSCVTLRGLVNLAYAGQNNPLKNRPSGADFVPDYPKGVRGGPPWADSETYTIEAKAEGVTDRATLTGPLLRALLEDRFQLKAHRATEQQSMYVLTVAKSGLKIKPLAPGECWEYEPGKPVPPHAENTASCGLVSGDGWGSYQAHGVRLGDAAAGRGDRMVDMLWRFLLRNVIDRTGLNARYSFALDFTPDDNTPVVRGRCGGNPNCLDRLPASVSDARPDTFKSNATIFQALEQQLGLHLELAKAPSEYIVIDHAERPKPNDPAADALPPTRVGGPSPSTSLRAGGPGK